MQQKVRKTLKTGGGGDGREVGRAAEIARQRGKVLGVGSQSDGGLAAARHAAETNARLHGGIATGHGRDGFSRRHAWKAGVDVRDATSDVGERRNVPGAVWDAVNTGHCCERSGGRERCTIIVPGAESTSFCHLLLKC